MGTRDPRIDAYIDKAQPFAKPILTFIRDAVHAGCPEVHETVKWGMPHFDHQGMLCGMASFKAHCSLGFWKGALLGIGEYGDREGMGQFGKIASLDDLPKRAQLVALVKKAATLNEQGVKIERTPKAPKAAIPMPDDFAAVLKKSKRANTAFEKLSPSHRREYLEWITGAKQDATRQRRMATAVDWLSEGKSLNWKYER